MKNQDKIVASVVAASPIKIQKMLFELPVTPSSSLSIERFGIEPDQLVLLSSVEDQKSGEREIS